MFVSNLSEKDANRGDDVFAGHANGRGGCSIFRHRVEELTPTGWRTAYPNAMNTAMEIVQMRRKLHLGNFWRVRAPGLGPCLDLVAGTAAVDGGLLAFPGQRRCHDGLKFAGGRLVTPCGFGILVDSHKLAPSWLA